MGLDLVVDVVEFLLSVGPGRRGFHVLVFPQVVKLIVDVPDRAAQSS